jgi:hypothetical protein
LGGRPHPVVRSILTTIVEKIIGRRQVDARQLADDLFSEEGDRRRERRRQKEAKIIRAAWESAPIQRLASEIGITESHLDDVYRRLMMHGDLRMARRAIHNADLLRWYYDHGGRDMRLKLDGAIQLFLFARDGRLE